MEEHISEKHDGPPFSGKEMRLQDGLSDIPTARILEVVR
jgi:hypothetical protein